MLTAEEDQNESDREDAANALLDHLRAHSKQVRGSLGGRETWLLAGRDKAEQSAQEEPAAA